MTSSYFSQNNSRPSQHRARPLEKVQDSTFSLAILIGFLVVSLGFFSILHVNQTATKGYQILGLEKEHSILILGNEKWAMKVAKLHSLDALKNNSSLYMVKAKNSLFIRGDSAVAKK